MMLIIAISFLNLKPAMLLYMHVVDCLKEGNQIVVARKSKLTILSSDFKETCCMPLLFQSWTDESDSEDTVIKGNFASLFFCSLYCNPHIPVFDLLNQRV
jgi:hypothetical protein